MQFYREDSSSTPKSQPPKQSKPTRNSIAKILKLPNLPAQLLLAPASQFYREDSHVAVFIYCFELDRSQFYREDSEAGGGRDHPH
ncbi:esterase/lipase [Aeropyrum camini SY1 = JCM 12091]|uniref:Esterase/lipase n=1 Tax=Aeropyrum camini SY1 = JCM 12091 TaxID=1198449 RepID=U3T8F7_9CREN|nr:esterase/lipase [Aeropyrum camini SY1 = JCM 12091]